MKPSVLYKFTSTETTEVILKNGYLRWSSPYIFNDLTEFQRIPRFKPKVSEVCSLLPQILLDAARGKRQLDWERLSPRIQATLYSIVNALHSGKSETEVISILHGIELPDADEIIEKRLRDHFKSQIQSTRVLCLTSAVDNQVMWGNYAENHHGCALGFTAAVADSPFHEARQVTYADEPPDLGSGLEFLLYGDSPELRRKTIEAVCYTKTAAWSYEHEWRLITRRTGEAESTYGDYIFFPEELASVTFGARAKPEFIETICAIIKERYTTLELFRMTHHNGELRKISFS